MADYAALPRSLAGTVPAEYRPLHRYLETRFADALVLTFLQIEDLLGHPLPNSAYSEPHWWDNAAASGAASPQSAAWGSAHRAATANLGARTVRFERTP
jgi:hypothetical protein